MSLLTDDMSMPMMPMYFTTNLPINVLFSSWSITNTTSLLWSCAIVIFMGYLRHIFLYLRRALSEANSPSLQKKREQLLNQDTDEDDTTNDKDIKTMILRFLSNAYLRRKQNRWVLRLLDALIYFLISTLSFLNMLIAMTYNPYLLVSVVFGETLGVFIIEGPPNLLQETVELSEAPCC